MSKEIPDFIAWEIYKEWAAAEGISIGAPDLSGEEIESLIKFAYRKGYDERGDGEN